MSNLTTVEKAHERRELFLDIHGKSRVIEIRLLYEMFTHGDYKNLGFDTFKDFVEAPRNSGGLDISRSWAQELVAVYQTYVKDLGMPEKKLEELSPRKLYLLKGKVNKKNLNTVLSEAQNVSMKGLEMEKKGINEATCDHEWSIWKRCRKCSVWEKPKLKKTDM